MATTRELGALSSRELEKLADSVWKSFENRATLWEERRKVRYRGMDAELGAMPLSKRAGGNKALMVFQTEEPNQEVHRRVKRLVANKARIEVIVYDTDDETKQLAQSIKDALKALWKWMNKGKIPADRRATEYQQADGLSFFKLDLVIDYADDQLAYYDPDVLEAEVSANESDAQTKARDIYRSTKDSYLSADSTDTEAASKAYKTATDKARRKCDPPFRLSAPDPLAIAYDPPDGDSIETVVERGQKKLSALLAALDSHKLRLIEHRLIVWPEGGDAAGGSTIPENEALGANYSDLVDYVEIRTKKEIVMLIGHPRLNGRNQRRLPGEDKYVKIAFENPFGPNSTGYVMCPGEITGSHDPAHTFQPAILGTLALAGPVNVLGTIRLSAAIDAALAPKYISVKDDAQPPPALSQDKSDKTPTVKDGEVISVIPGEVKRVETSNIDLDKAEGQFNAMMAMYRFNEVLAGDSTSSDSGHKLAIQVSQADTQLVPFQNSRAEAIAEVLMCCLYATKKLGVPIFVKESPDQDSIMMNRIDPVQPIRALTPDMYDLDFNLIVSIGSETPVTKFAKWSALESRYKAGTLSYETLMEQSDVENVADEIARVFEGQTLTAVMQQTIPVIVQMIAQKTVAKIINAPQQTVGEGGNANGGGMPGAVASTPIAGVGRLPGVGMSPGGPTSGDFGGRTQLGAGDAQGGVS